MPNSTTQTPSPAKPIKGNILQGYTESFYFKNQPEKTIGASPGGSKLNLKRHEGKHHHRVRETGTSKTYSAASPLESPLKHSYKSNRLRLDAMMLDLKERSDQDLHIFNIDNKISDGHYQATRTVLKNCIKQLDQCCDLSINKDYFIQELNDLILDGKIYNPISLKILYPTKGYRADLKDRPEEYNTQIDIASINLAMKGGVKKNLANRFQQFDPSQNKPQAAEPDKVNLGKRKKPASNFFVPRSVKLKKASPKDNPAKIKTEKTLTNRPG